MSLSALLDLANILKFTAISAMVLELKICYQNSHNLSGHGIKKVLLTLILLFSPVLHADDNPDQLLVIYGSSGYVLYKVLDFANDHGFRFIKILSYEFKEFDHLITGKCNGTDPKKGRYFELKDENAKISFLCFTEAPSDPCTIDLEKYRYILERLTPE